MKVRLIKNNWDNSPSGWFKNVLKVGETLPELNQIYTVKTQYVDLDTCEVKGYELEEFDFSNYDIETKTETGIKIEKAGFFRSEIFEVIPTPFENNAIDKSSGMLCRKENYVIGISGKLLTEMDLKILNNK